MSVVSHVAAMGTSMVMITRTTTHIIITTMATLTPTPMYTNMITRITTITITRVILKTTATMVMTVMMVNVSLRRAKFMNLQRSSKRKI